MHNQQTYVQNWIPRNWWSLIAETFIIFWFVCSSAIFRWVFFQQKMLKIEFRGIVGRQIWKARWPDRWKYHAVINNDSSSNNNNNNSNTNKSSNNHTSSNNINNNISSSNSSNSFGKTVPHQQWLPPTDYHKVISSVWPPSGARRRVWKSYCMGSVSGMCFPRESVSREINFDCLEPSNH